MNVFLLCFFALVPFQNASVHEAGLIVCPDFAQILRFQNELARYQIPTTDSAFVPVQEAEPEPIPVEQLEPEIVPEQPAKPEKEIAQTAHKAEPAPLEIKDEIPSLPVSSDENVKLASAEELIPNVQPFPVPTAAPVASNVPEVASTDEPIRRPWGVLTFFIFLLLLSVSVNVFLGWQLIEVRKAKLK